MTPSANEYVSSDNRISQNDRSTSVANNRDLSRNGLSSDVNLNQSPDRIINNTNVQSSPNQPVAAGEIFQPFLFNSTIKASSSNPGINLSENQVGELEVAYNNNTNSKRSASEELKDTALSLENDNKTTATTGTMSVQNNTLSSPESIIATSNNTTNPSSNPIKDNNTTILSLQQSTSNGTDTEKLNATEDRSLFPANNTTTGTASNL